MKKTISILANLTLIISLLLLAAVLVAPPLLGLTLEPILSGSMEPAISVGAMIAIEATAPEEIQVGDIIGFNVEGMDIPVCHRVIEIVDTEVGIGFRTKGDANEEADDWVVQPENLIGKVVFNLPWLGYLAGFVQTRYGFALLLGLPAMIIIALEMKNIVSPQRPVRRRPRLREKPQKFPAYLSIVIGLLFTGVVWGMMVANTHHDTLDSLARPNEEPDQPSYVGQRIIQNRGILPLVMLFFSEDETVSFSEEHFWLSTGRQKEIEITGDEGTAVVKAAGFLPLLPQETLHRLFAWDSRFGSLIAAAVWIIPLSMIVFLVLRILSPVQKPAQRAKYLKGMLNYA